MHIDWMFLEVNRLLQGNSVYIIEHPVVSLNSEVYIFTY